MSDATRLKGATFIVVSQIAKLITQFLGLVILSHLVAPEYFGHIALLVSIASMLEILRDWGNTTKSLQRPQTVNHLQDRMGWHKAAIFVGLIAVLLFISIAVLFFGFTSQESLIAVVIVGSSLLANGLGAQPNVQLVVEKRMLALSLIEIFAQIFAFAAGLTLAQAGFSLIGLAVQFAGLSWANALAKFSLFRFNIMGLTKNDVKSYFNGGWHLTGLASMSFISYNVDNLILGLRFKPETLGFYSRAFQIYMVPVAQLIWPLEKLVLASAHEHKQKNVLQEILLNLHVACTVFSGLAFTLIASTSNFFVPVLLGEQWQASSYYLQILCIAGLFQVPNLLVHWLLLINQKNRTLFRLAVIRALITTLCLVLFGMRAEGIPVGLAFASAVNWVVGSWFVIRENITEDVRVFNAITARILAASTLAFATQYFVTDSLGSATDATKFAVKVALSILLFMAATFIFGGPRTRQVLSHNPLKLLRKDS